MFYVRLFGFVQVECDGAHIYGFESEKALALLGYLTLQHRPVARRHLAGLFWGEKSETRALSNLRRVLHNLTRLLPGCLEVTRHTVQFLPSDQCQTDAAQFEALTATGRPADLAEAVRLYRADLMEGMSFPDCPEFEIWLVGEREFWRQRVIQGLQTLIEHHRRRGDDEQGILFASRLLALAPWREEGHRRLMRFLARSGRRAAALAQYETCRRILQKELGVPPSPETRALYERIRDAPAPRHNLPLDPTPFVGRSAELAEIARSLADDACRLLTLVGPGGVGKTRLALQAARAEVHTFLHGVFFVPLAGLEEPRLLAAAIAEALDLRLKGREPATAQLLAYLRDKELLLVLDNFEHLLTPPHAAGAVSPVLEILQQAPEVKVMVTSRQRLNLRWEWIVEVSGLTYPDCQAPTEAGHSAVALFVQSARRAHRRSLADEMEEVAHLCRLLEGLPLGIELAAAWTGEYSCAEIGRQIERGLDALVSSARDYPPRHRSLRAVCDHSWSLLNPAEQQAFRRLAPFAGSFDREAALAVTGARRATLSALVEKSLLRETHVGRYLLHAVLRRYAEEQLNRSPQETEATRERFCAHYADFLHRQEGALQGPHQKSALQAIESEIEHLRRAWEWATERRDADALQKSAYSLYLFHEMQGRYQDGVALFGAAVEVCEARPAAEDEPLLGRLLAHWGWFLHRTDAGETARAALERGLALAQRLDDREYVPLLLVHLGDAARVRGEYEQAESFLRWGLHLYRHLEDQAGVARALNMLGIVASIRGEHATARACFEESLALHRELGAPFGIALALNNLGIALDEAGDPDAAQALYLECLSIRQDLGDHYGMAAVLGNLGVIADSRGRPEEARRYYEHCIKIAREFNYRAMIAGLLNNLGTLDCKRGDYAAAERRFRESLELSAESDDLRRMALTLNRLGKAQIEAGHISEAWASLRRALRLAHQVQALPVLLEGLLHVATLLAREGRAEQAAALLTFVAGHPACTRDLHPDVERLRGAVPGVSSATESPLSLEAALEMAAPRPDRSRG